MSEETIKHEMQIDAENLLQSILSTRAMQTEFFKREPKAIVLSPNVFRLLKIQVSMVERGAFEPDEKGEYKLYGIPVYQTTEIIEIREVDEGE